jgi:ornithine decarboxylase
LLLHARDLGLVPDGISFHVGSQATNPVAWKQEIVALKPIIEHLDSLGMRIELLNIGGGFPTQYALNDVTLALEDIAASVYEAMQELPYQPQLMLEPGRGLVANTGVAVASVIGKVERPEYTWLFLDLGVYNGLFESMAYQGSTRYRVSSMRPSYHSGETLFALAGPTGDSPDVITREALLPQDIGVGDKLIFHSIGAYSLVATSAFNGFPKPGVYFIYCRHEHELFSEKRRRLSGDCRRTMAYALLYANNRRVL